MQDNKSILTVIDLLHRLFCTALIIVQRLA